MLSCHEAKVKLLSGVLLPQSYGFGLQSGQASLRFVCA